jgi:hypothetical protein
VKTTKRQIIAIGEGGFAVESKNPALELTQCIGQGAQTEPSGVSLPTASSDSAIYISKFYAASTKH